jgi:predicted ATP-dependent endonuclease of OLD family
MSIRNFRNFRAIKLLFTKGINTIVGENGSGKTNLFYALRILIDASLPRYIRLSQSDFCRALAHWAGNWIIISIVFEDLDASEEAQAMAFQATGHMDAESKGSYSVYFRPKYQFRKELYDYSETPGKNQTGLRLLLDKLTAEDYETVYLCRGTGDFSQEDVYKTYVGDFENIIFPNPDQKEDLVFGTWLPKEISIHNEVSCTFIKALRDVEADLRSYANNPLVNLLRGKEKSVEIAKQAQIIESIDNLNEQIGKLEEVESVRTGIDESIKNAVGTTYAPNIAIVSELPNEMEKLFQSLKLWVGDPDEEGYKGRIWELSLGGANLIYLSLKLLEYEKTKTDKVANFLLIEEPESHIHAHIQKTLFKSLGEGRTQVIISTHSTHISSASKISSVNVLSRGNREAFVFQPATNLTSDEVSRVERYLDAVRSNLLFAKGILLVEGDAEQILIPEMFKCVFGLSLDEIGVSLINIGSTGFENVARIFHKDRIRKQCAIITDRDESIVELSKDASKDNDFQKHCRASQMAGNERYTRLTAFCRGNNFVQPYFSPHTFEVDFLMNGNSYEVTLSLEAIYDSAVAISRSKAKLEDDSIEIAGAEVLRLAEKLGKGWFALLLSEHLFYNTNFPVHILQAIAFASPHINLCSQAKAAIHRVHAIRANDNDPLLQEQAKRLRIKGKSDTEILQIFRSTFPDDQLTAFIGFL